MSDEQHTGDTAEEPSNPENTEEPSAAPEGEAPEQEAGRPGHEGHSLGKEVAEGVAKVWGYTVEASSIFAGQGGGVVDAERQMAEKEAEDFLEGERDEDNNKE